MGVKSSIEWTDSTWSALRARVRHNAGEIALEKGYSSLVEIGNKMAGRVGQHCEHVSDGCKFCYSGTWQSRCLPVNGTGLPFDRRSRDLIESIVDDKALMLPLRWRSVRVHAERCGKTVLGKQAACTCFREDKYRTRSLRIFVENQSDLFGEWITDEQIDRVFAVMALCPQHTFQVLTKRPERMLAYLAPGESALFYRWAFHASAALHAMTGVNDLERDIASRPKGWPLPNVWLGVSVENQATADARIPLLLRTPAAKRFVSYEPALGPVEFNGIAWWECDECYQVHDEPGMCHECENPDPMRVAGTHLDWIITGGESGPGARPADPDWFRSVRDQCANAGVPFFFKQWGDWAPAVSTPGGAYPKNAVLVRRNGEIHSGAGLPSGATWMQRVGKKKAGALLDGREHREFPAGEAP